MESILRKAWALTLLLPLVGGLLGGWRFGVSVLLGALLMLLNIRWLTAGVDRVLGRPQPRSDALLAVKFLLRLALILMVLFAMIRFSFLSLTGALLGLSVFVLAGIAEAVSLLLRGGKSKR